MGLSDRVKQAVGKRLAGFLADYMPGMARELSPESYPGGAAVETGVYGLDKVAAAAGRWKVSRERHEQHKLRERMDSESPLVSKALDIYADVATAPEDDDADATAAFEVECEDDAVREEAERLVEQIGLRERSWDVARRCAHYGNEMREVVVDPARGRVVRFKPLPEQEMFRREDEYGRPKDPPWEQRAYWQPDATGIGFAEWQVVHYKYGGADEKYGRGVLWAAEAVWMKLQAVEDAMVVGRMQRSPSREVHKVPVDRSGGSDEVMKQLQDYERHLKRRRLLDAVYGTKMRDNPWAAGQDLYIPYYGEEWKGSGVEMLDPSNAQLTNIRDVEYLRSILLARLGVPMRYLNLGGAEAVRASIGAGGVNYEDRQFARTVRRIQAVVAGGHKRVILYHLILQSPRLNPIEHPVTLAFPVISTEDAERNAKIERMRAEALRIYAQVIMVPPELVVDRYMELSAEDKEHFFGELREAAQARAAGEKPPAKARHLRELAASALVMAETMAKESGIDLRAGQHGVGPEGGEPVGAGYPRPARSG